MWPCNLHSNDLSSTQQIHHLHDQEDDWFSAKVNSNKRFFHKDLVLVPLWAASASMFRVQSRLHYTRNEVINRLKEEDPNHCCILEEARVGSVRE